MRAMTMKTMARAAAVGLALACAAPVSGQSRAAERDVRAALERARAAQAEMRADRGAERVQTEEVRAALAQARVQRAEVLAQMGETRAQTQEVRVALEAAQMAMARTGAGMGIDAVRRAMEETRMDLSDLWGRSASRAPLALAPAPWLQEDPGAKAYQTAREALNDRRYEVAAKAFADLRKQYPSSGYVADSYYWQAFALYRQDGSANLRAATELLREQGSRFPQASTRSDAEELRVRIEAQLARRGDARAAEAITRQASEPCNDEQQETRAAALSALLTMNADQAMPILKKVLQSRGECSAELRRQAVFLISQKMTDESVDILLDLAHRNPDPDPEVREQAVFWLSQVKSPEALDALESILKESKDPDIQEKAVFAISQHGSERAFQILRAYAERTDAPEELRANAIFWIGQNPRAGGTQYLIDLYPKLTDPDLKERAIFSIGQGHNAESRAWLLARAKDRSEEVDVRKNALFWAGQSGGLSVDDLKGLYGTLTDPEMKEQVIFVASQKKDPGAVDFLMDVAKTEKDKDLRQRAIFWLGQSKDPRVADFLLSLISG